MAIPVVIVSWLLPRYVLLLPPGSDCNTILEVVYLHGASHTDLPVRDGGALSHREEIRVPIPLDRIWPATPKLWSP